MNKWEYKFRQCSWNHLVKETTSTVDTRRSVTRLFLPPGAEHVSFECGSRTNTESRTSFYIAAHSERKTRMIKKGKKKKDELK